MSAFTSTGTATNAANFNTVTAATLPAMGQPVTLPQLASDPNLPTYDVDYLSGSNPDAWARAVVTVDESLRGGDQTSRAVRGRAAFTTPNVAAVAVVVRRGKARVQRMCRTDAVRTCRAMARRPAAAAPSRQGRSRG